MPDRTWFVDWFNSPYYYLLYENRNDSEAFSFIQTIIDYLKPAKDCRMLDVACGRGRHSKALAEMGFQVTGIDISLEAIEEAKKEENEQLQFFQHDMRLPFWINYFDYAFNLFTSFGYFRTQREHDNAIRTISQSLKLNGLFIMDYLNVHYAEDHLEKSHTKEVNSVKFHISKWHDDEHFFKQIQVEEKGVALKHLFTEKVAKFSLGDLTDMFAYQGMQIQEVFGDYHLGHYDVRKSPRMIVVAKKIRY
jgi:SAM-dependent methyltransferase